MNTISRDNSVQKTRVSQFTTRQQSSILKIIAARYTSVQTKEMSRTEFNALIVKIGNEVY